MMYSIIMTRNEKLNWVTMVANLWCFSMSVPIIITLAFGIIKIPLICKGDKLSSFKPKLNNAEPGVDPNVQGCVMMDGRCIALSDVSSYEAIRALHAHLDDDQSGDIDLSESVDFLREELNYTKGLEKRQKAFHYNNDQHISVHELWDIWLANEVHNWTVEQTVGWLHVCVELGQYADIFYENAINGSLLPRLATNNDHFLTRILGIKSSTHRSKISIKAMDIVLFGPPKETGSLVKDIFIASLIFVILVMLFKFRQMTQSNNGVLTKMEQDMEALQEELRRFQDEKFQEEKGDDCPSVGDGKERGDGDQDHSPSPLDEPVLLGDDFTCSSDVLDLDPQTSTQLQGWLQLTYEKERIILEKKIKAMTLQFQEAREICDRLKPSRKNMFGAFSFIHGRLESRGQSIYEARTALGEIQEMKKEMENRWTAMEELLGFNIRQNPDMVFLESLLGHSSQSSFIHHPANTVGVQQLLRSQFALMFLTMGGYPGLERLDESPSGARNRYSCRSQAIRAAKWSSSVRGGSALIRDPSVESISDASIAPSIASAPHNFRPRSLQASLPHSYTVASGLSNADSDQQRLCSTGNDGVFRRIASLTRVSNAGLKNNGGNSINNGYSTEETDSANFTIGDSGAIHIESSSGRSAEEQGLSPPHSPSAVSLQESPKEDLPSNPSIDKVRTRRIRLRLLGKSYSHDEEGSIQMGHKQENLGKFSSEPSLDVEQSPSTLERKSSSKPFTKGFLNRSKWITKKLKKPDKSNN